MPTAATGAHGKKLEKLVAMVAASQTFIDAVNDPGSEAGHVQHPTMKVDPETTAVDWPLAVVMTGPDFKWTKQGIADGIDLTPSGSLQLLLLNVDEDPADLQESEMLFMNFWDGVLQDLVASSGVDTSLRIVGTEMIQQPAHSPPRQENVAGDYWHCRHVIRYA